MKRNEPISDQNQLKLDDFSIYTDTVAHLPKAKKGTADSLRIRYKNFGDLTFADYEVFSQLPDHPFWSRVDQVVDFSFADELCAPLYSSIGQRPYAPSLKLKIHMVQAFENLSDREMEMRLMYDIAIKRFVGVPVSFNGFDHSTIGLDRERMGDSLFEACFHYILAQARAHKLWTVQGDRWLIDTFQTLSISKQMSCYRLIKHGILNLIQHMKRCNRPLFEQLEKMLNFTTWFEYLDFSASEEGKSMAFNQLVARAYSLLHGFENDVIKKDFWAWSNKQHQLRSLTLQAILCRILAENTRPYTKTDVDNSGKSLELEHERIPRKERPKNRIENAHDPDMRLAKKGKHVFFGDKIQVLESDSSGLIVAIEAIPGNEHDGQRMKKMVQRSMEIHGASPTEVVGDTAYGSGPNRLAFREMELDLCAPVAPPSNPSGLFSSELFFFNKQKLLVTCPANQTTTHRTRNKQQEAFQYKFPKQVCATCPLKEQCTNNKTGRTITINDNYDMFEAAKNYNESEQGKASLQSRYKVERTNNELANHHEMRHPRTRRRSKLNAIAQLKGMVINIKLMVKKLVSPVSKPFIRRKRFGGLGFVCS